MQGGVIRKRTREQEEYRRALMVKYVELRRQALERGSLATNLFTNPDGTNVNPNRLSIEDFSRRVKIANLILNPPTAMPPVSQFPPLPPLAPVPSRYSKETRERFATIDTIRHMHALAHEPLVPVEVRLINRRFFRNYFESQYGLIPYNPAETPSLRTMYETISRARENIIETGKLPMTTFEADIVIVLIYADSKQGDKGVGVRSIRLSDIPTTYERFVDLVTSIFAATGDYSGSDKLNSDDYEMNTSRFDLHSYSVEIPQNVYNSLLTRTCLFQDKGDGLCVLYVIRHFCRNREAFFDLLHCAYSEKAVAKLKLIDGHIVNDLIASAPPGLASSALLPLLKVVLTCPIPKLSQEGRKFAMYKEELESKREKIFEDFYALKLADVEMMCKDTTEDLSKEYSKFIKYVRSMLSEKTIAIIDSEDERIAHMHAMVVNSGTDSEIVMTHLDVPAEGALRDVTIAFNGRAFATYRDAKESLRLPPSEYITDVYDIVDEMKGIKEFAREFMALPCTYKRNADAGDGPDDLTKEIAEMHALRSYNKHLANPFKDRLDIDRRSIANFRSIDKWRKKNELGSLGIVLPATNVSGKKGNTESPPERFVRSVMSLKVREQACWAKKPKPITKYVFFDFETITDYTALDVLKPYSISYLVLIESELKKLGECGIRKDDEAKAFVDSIDQRTTCIIGYDCVAQFIQKIDDLCNIEDTKIVFISYNGVYFDHFILIEHLLRTDQERVSDITYANGGILNAKIDKRHRFFDLHKHLTFGSLAANCAAFKIMYPKLEISHYEMQKKYNESPQTLIDYCTSTRELIEYNNRDVLSLAILTQCYLTALSNIPGFSMTLEGLVTKRVTVGTTVYKTWRDYIEDQRIKVPKFFSNRNLDPCRVQAHMQYYDDMLKSKVAGRCCLYNGPIEVPEKCASLDITSSYPYNMGVGGFDYPIGEITEVSDEEHFIRNCEHLRRKCIGWFYCDIDQTPIRAQGLPNIYPLKGDSGNDWETKEIIKNVFISTVEIAHIRKYGGIVTTRNGIMFSDVISGSVLFNIVLRAMGIKIEQDSFKASRDPVENAKYNPALRETVKLVLNSLSGKVIEGLHTDKVKLLKKESELLEIMGKKKANVIQIYKGRILVQYEDAVEKSFKKARPVFYGCLIYTYARSYLYDHVISKIPLKDMYYTDTDSVKVRYTALIEWAHSYGLKTMVPHSAEAEAMDPNLATFKLVNYVPGYGIDEVPCPKYTKVFGSFADEYAEMGEVYGPNSYNLFCAKKTYMMGIRSDGGEVKVCKALLKGVGQGDLLIPNIKLGDESSKELWRKRAEIVMGNPDDAIYEIPEATKERTIAFNETMQYWALNWDPKKKTRGRGCGPNMYFLMHDLFHTGEAHVLCSSLKKSLRQTLHGVSEKDVDKFNQIANHIQQCFRVKQLSLAALKASPKGALKASP